MTIRNDATRATIRPRDGRRPRAVVARQGQVLLDADLDQQSRHLLDRLETESADELGSPGRLAARASCTASSNVNSTTAPRRTQCTFPLRQRTV